jgi:hypothetical protein
MIVRCGISGIEGLILIFWGFFLGANLKELQKL